jgi:hypothetical protein
MNVQESDRANLLRLTSYGRKREALVTSTVHKLYDLDAG